MANICTSVGSWKKQESSRKASISALLTLPKPFTVWITTNWKILKEMGIPDNLTCLLRNLYAGQEATVRTGHGTIDWFQIGIEVLQGCIVSPWLFNLYAHGTTDWFQIGIEVLQGCIVPPWLFNLYAHPESISEKCWAGRSASWNQDCQEKYQ